MICLKHPLNQHTFLTCLWIVNLRKKHSSFHYFEEREGPKLQQWARVNAIKKYWHQFEETQREKNYNKNRATTQSHVMDFKQKYVCRCNSHLNVITCVAIALKTHFYATFLDKGSMWGSHLCISKGKHCKSCSTMCDSTCPS